MAYRFPMFPLLTVCVALTWPAAIPAQTIQTEHVSFATGTTGTNLQGRLVGDQMVDYVLTASGGQAMTVDMATSNPSAYFNIMKSSDPAGIYNASVEGLHYSGVLPSGGDWVIRVYLMRNAARRGETADYTIAVNIRGGDGVTAAPAVRPASGPDETCRAAVASMANTTEVAVVSSEFSQAGTMVRLAVGPDRAPWQCIGYQDGSTAGVMFVGNDSAGVTPAPAPDFADGNSGGPDWWQVAVSGSLNVRSGPGTVTQVVGKAANGQLLRNLGCQGMGAERWCHVEVDDGAYQGWVKGDFLREGAMPQ